MFKKNVVLIMVILVSLFITSNLIANDTSGLDNGKSWIQTECKKTIEVLENENDDLIQQLVTVQAELDALKSCKKYESEQRKFALFIHSDDHPNTPGAFGIYSTLFIFDPAARDIINNMVDGSYEIAIKVTDPNGLCLSAKSSFLAELVDRPYYDYQMEIIP